MAEKWRRRNEFGGHALMGGGTLNIKIISQISGDKGVNVAGDTEGATRMAELTGNRKSGNFRSKPTQTQEYERDANIFIVHGHDTLARIELKDYLQNTLGFPAPVILAELPDCGRTIIEKFEEQADQADIVFVLLTPDDFNHENQARARQNVIFELGYFIGKMGRKSGRVILLSKGNLDIPSDLSGILRIDIGQGIRTAGEDIRKAVKKALETI